MRIGMFDSGVGGLTVLKAFLKIHPNNEYIYCGDTLNIPYGDKDKQELLILSTKMIKFLEAKNVDMIIIACGTICSTIYDELKKVSKVPIYSIIERVPMYIKEKNYQNILLMATSGSIKSHTLKNKMKDRNIIELSCPKLVPFIENRNQIELDVALNEYVKDLPKVEAIILGCTHYPIIKENIKDKFNYDLELIDMGKILAESLSIVSSHFKMELYFSKVTDNIIENVKMILK